MIGSHEVRDVFKVERKGAHSHITGLGTGDGFEPMRVGDGLVGQEKARRAAALIVQMVKVCPFPIPYSLTSSCPMIVDLE